MNDASTGQISDTQVSNGKVLESQAGDGPPDDNHVPPDRWHYKDERSGKRVGPVERSTIAALIAAKRIDRATLVWQPAMADWAKAGHSELAGLFGAEPPPLPAGEIGRGAIYTLALFPLWGTVVVFLISVPLARQLAMEPHDVFSAWLWWTAFITVNYVLSTLDEHNLRRGGARVYAPSMLGTVLTPVYILASCLAMQRHACRRAWLAYLPLLLWVLAFVAAFLFHTLAFNPDAPALFNPDQWF